MQLQQLSTIETYVNLGFSLIPLSFAWNPCIKEYASLKEKGMPLADAMLVFGEKKAVGVAVVCGKVSGHIRCIDVECKHDRTGGELWAGLEAALQEWNKELFEKFYIQSSRNNGRHVFFKCEAEKGEHRLARRLFTDSETDEYNREKGTKIEYGKRAHLLIEERGEGDLINLPPSLNYKVLQGSLSDLPIITAQQRFELLEICRKFDQMPEVVPEPEKPKKQRQIFGDSVSPAEDFNKNVLIEGILEAHNWTRTQTKSDFIYFAKPGRNDKQTDVSVIIKSNRLKVWGEGCGLSTDKTLSAFDLVCILEYNSDVAAAMKGLNEKGYGTQKQPTPAKNKAEGNTDTENVPEQPKQIKQAAAQSDGKAASNEPFNFLGYRKNGTNEKFVFFVRESKVILEFAATELKKANLYTLADANWWEGRFRNKQGLDLDAAQNYLIRYSHKAGYFDPARLRGRGAWWDNGRAVIHTGESIIVDGKRFGLCDFESEFIYEHSVGAGFNLTEKATNKECSALVDLIGMLPFKNEVDKSLFLGWCALAPICGVLKTRPNLFLTGSADSGKTWIQANVVRNLLGRVALYAKGGTTAAGLQSALRIDAVPVSFDEFEPTDEAAMQRIDAILGLMRISFTEDDSQVIKGTQSQGDMRSSIHSMFCFSAIVNAANKASDISRMCNIEVAANPDKAQRKAHFENLLLQHAAVFTEGFTERFQSRIISLIPTILKNVVTFTRAAHIVAGSQRGADKIGCLAAGCYAVLESGEISYDWAVNWLSAFDWAVNDNKTQKDEEKLLGLILQHSIRVDGVGRTTERSVGELIELVLSPPQTQDIPFKVAEERLKRFGIVIKIIPGASWGDAGVMFANDSEPINRLLQGTPFYNGWQSVLARLDGAKKTPQSINFVTKSRAVNVPLKWFDIS